MEQTNNKSKSIVNNLIKKKIKRKVISWVVGSTSLTFVSALIGIIIILLIILGANGNSNNDYEIEGGGLPLSPEVLKWKTLVDNEATKQNASEYVPLILALIQVESGGRGTKDIMQSSESAGFSVNHWSSEEQSVRQGIKYIMSIVTNLKSYNKGYEKNFKLIAQSFNFGSAFASYVGKRGGDYSLSIAEDYSRTVVAPSLGNSSGQKYAYINAVSTRLGKQYLYLNGGNFMYGEKISEYMGTVKEKGNSKGSGTKGKGNSTILNSMLGQSLYNGECYGLVAWYVDKMGGPKMMGSGFMNAWSIGSDYNWESFGWKVIFNPSFNDLQAGDIINWKAGGRLAPGIYGHTGVISSVLKNGEFTTYEQNAEKGRINASYTRTTSINPIVSIVRKVK